ncbi:MAG: hypothetical protein RLZZ450_299 [Pseudomonadota bacterium]
MLLALAGCGDDGGGSDGPCSPISGTWLYRYTERPSGLCDVGIIETIAVVGAAAPAAKCTGSVAVSEDRCEITYRRFRCRNPQTGDFIVTDGTLRLVADDRLEGIVQMAIESADPSISCTSVFDVTATQQ